jgi:hypothetical protein
MAKKKKLTPEERHRQIQDQVQALPYAIAKFESEGKKGRVMMLKYVTGPVLRFMNRMLSKQRYGGPEGAKLKQSEQMKRHLEQRQKAMDYVQGELRKTQKRQQKRGGGKPR